MYTNVALNDSRAYIILDIGWKSAEDESLSRFSMLKLIRALPFENRIQEQNCTNQNECV